MRGVLLAGALAVMASLSAQDVAAAEFLNGGFTSDLSAWQTTGVHSPDALTAVVVAGGPAGGVTHIDADGNETVYGSNDADPFFGYLMATGDPAPTTLYQGFTITGRTHFSGSAAFLGADELPYNDFGWVRIYAGASDAVIFPLAETCVLAAGCVRQLFYADIAGVGDYGATPWTGFSIDLEPGDYFIAAHVANGPIGDTFNPSHLAVDAFQAVAIPEPATWAMLIGGFFGLGAMLRRRRAALA